VNLYSLLVYIEHKGDEPPKDSYTVYQHLHKLENYIT
jgi:hypothetical protein